MVLWMIIKISLRSLMLHKMRTTPVMLGIMIGMGSVIAMLSIDARARELFPGPSNT
jgi:hypothetical protein